jgi:hypothetical protein
MADKLDNLKKAKGFDKLPGNINKDGRPVGTKNRSTILKKWIEVNVKIRGKANPYLEDVTGTVEDEIVLALITKARGGDVQAIKEVYDTLYGKIQENQRIEGIPQSINITVDSSQTGETLKKLRDGTKIN